MTNLGETCQPSNRNEPINFSKSITSSNLHFAEEPEVVEAVDQIWKSQVIITCPNSTHAFLVPLSNPKEDQEQLSAIFSCFEKHKPLIFTEGPYDLSFLRSKFRTEPKHENNEEHLRWLNKVEKKERSIFERYRYL